MTGIAQRHQIFVFGQATLFPWPNVMDVQLNVCVVVGATPANLASISISLNDAHSVLWAGSTLKHMGRQVCGHLFVDGLGQEPLIPDLLKVVVVDKRLPYPTVAHHDK